MELKDKIAVITGGASGLGEATVRRFVNNGAKVAIFDMNEERAANIISELGDDNVKFFNVDVTKTEMIQAGIDGTVAAFGAIHICCNFAGIAWPTKTLSKDGPADIDTFKKVVDINLIGSFDTLRLAAFEMAKNEPLNDSGCRGVILNTASIAAYEGQIGQAAYSASKGGIVGMTLPIARDLARDGIRVNTIVPGIIHTPLFELMPEELYQSLESQALFPQRLGKPEEIAHLAQYLVENDYMNAECVRMDAGIRMQPR
ncbi:MAG: SDR family NAD(P)-dependent oxidoreductase [Parvibaculales bacterium]